MKDTIKHAVTAATKIKALFKPRIGAFCNIAEGTHAGAITMVAGENVDSQNLVVSTGRNDGEFVVASVNTKPIGVCVDQGASGERLTVALPASTSSTLVCKTASDVSQGDSLYTSANGKVSAIAGDGAYKVGIALCAATTGGFVEIDPQGFGESAWRVHSCGVFAWTGSSNTASLDCATLTENDVVIANIYAAAGSEKNVKAVASENKINFTLDANGTQSTTKIAWIAIGKN